MKSIIFLIMVIISSHIFACDSDEKTMNMELSKDDIAYKHLWVYKDHFKFYGKYFTSESDIKLLLDEHTKEELYIGVDSCSTKEHYNEFKNYAISIGIKHIIEGVSLCICIDNPL